MKKLEIKKLINKKSPVIFEIGCADGIDTLEFLEEFNGDIKLYCFEPDERNANIFVNGGHRPLKPNLTQPIKHDNIIFEKKAVGNVDGIVEFNQSSTIYSSSLKKPIKNLFDTWDFIEFNNILKVECVKLDTYVDENKIDKIDFIWADVQRAEDLLIKGGKKTFDNKVKFLYTEYAKDLKNEFYENSPNMDKILELLGDNWVVIKDYGTDILLKNNNL